MENYWKIAGITGTAGLVLAISLAYGLDISKEGITLIVIWGLFEGLKGLGWKILYLLTNLAFFIGGIILTYITVLEIFEEEWEVIAVSILSFASMFIIYLGMALNSTLQNFGAYLLVIDLIFIIGLSKFG